MAFFRKWKLHYKHKKLSEEWALATSLKDMSEISEESTSSSTSDDIDGSNVTTFDLKYLGSTSIDAEKSQKSTADAIKSVISLSKAARRKTQRIKLNVSPQGIEVLNATTGDNLIRVSIYKISYCSADAANDHVFAFVGSETDTITTDENLFCHVFYCPKRKIAHDVTLTVARCFENAYQIWKEAIDRKMKKVEKRNLANEISMVNNNYSSSKIEQNNEEKEVIRDLLIDLTPSDFENNVFDIRDGRREYLQNTWVSFDDDNQRNDLGRLIVC